jgi:hypothetical protein
MVSVRVVNESKDSFYVHLLSNAQPELFNNKANHFKCQLETLLQFPPDEEWEVGVREFHYVNNVNTITKALKIEVGGLFPLGGITTTKGIKFPHYFTECGTHLKLFHPLQAICQKTTPSNVISTFSTFLRQERLRQVVRLYMECGATEHCYEENPPTPWNDRWFKLNVHDSTAEVNALYPGARYALFLSFPLAVVLNADTQCILGRAFNADKPKRKWSKVTWLGSDSHFKEYTLITDSSIRRTLVQTFTEKAMRAATPNLVAQIQRIQTHLSQRPAQTMDYWMTFMPLHRTRIQTYTLYRKDLTYVDLFQQLEDLGFGSLYIDPDQEFLEFSMHDSVASGTKNMRFAVELPSALFGKNPRVRVNKWELKDCEDGKKKLIRKFNVLMGGLRSQPKAIYSSLNYTSAMGLTTFKLEKALERFAEEDDSTKLIELITRMDTELNRVARLTSRATLSLMHGLNTKNYNKTFVLTSNMVLRLSLNASSRKTFPTTELAKASSNVKHVYTPHDFGIYDVKVPFLRTDAESFTITTYAQQLEEGKYNIRDEGLLFHDMYSPHYSIDTKPGFYTPKSFIHSLEQNFVQNNSPCSIALIHQDMDDNEQGFLQITTGDSIYLQFDDRSKELFQLEHAFLPPNSVFTSKRPFDLIPDTHTVLIYCNLAGESIVGGQREKVLTIAPITYNKYKWGKWVGQVFASTDYYPVAMKSVQLIEIQFRGDTGDFLPITQGRCYVKLHFQQKRRS